MAIVAVALTVGACGDQRSPTEAVHEATTAWPIVAPTFDFVEGQYPTEEEYIGEGGSMVGDVNVRTTVGAFNSDATSWTATGWVSFQWVNEANAALASSLIDHDGNAVNSGGDSYTYASTIPLVSRVDKTLQSTISTNNHNCGITGKARLTATASLKLLKNPTNLTLVWSGNFDSPAPDITLPTCPAEEPGEGGGGEGGGGGGDDGGGSTCGSNATLSRPGTPGSSDLHSAAFSTTGGCGGGGKQNCGWVTYGEWNPYTGEVYWSETGYFCFGEDGSQVSGPSFTTAGERTSFVPEPNSAMASSPEQLTRATVLGTGALPNRNPASISWQAGSRPSLVIAIDTTRATEQDARAIMRVAAALITNPGLASHDVRFELDASTVTDAPRDTGLAESTRLLRNIRRGAVRVVNGIGAGRAVDIELPNALPAKQSIRK